MAHTYHIVPHSRS